MDVVYEFKKKVKLQFEEKMLCISGETARGEKNIGKCTSIMLKEKKLLSPLECAVSTFLHFHTEIHAC